MQQIFFINPHPLPLSLLLVIDRGHLKCSVAYFRVIHCASAATSQTSLIRVHRFTTRQAFGHRRWYCLQPCRISGYNGTSLW